MGRLARLLLQRVRTGHVHLLASRRRSRGEPTPSFRRTSRTQGTVITQGIKMIDPHSSRPRVFDESEAGGKYETLVTGLALLKPLAVIVSPQHSQKLEEFRREVRPAGNRAQLHQYSLIDFVLLSSTIPDKFYGLARRQRVYAELPSRKGDSGPQQNPPTQVRLISSNVLSN